MRWAFRFAPLAALAAIVACAGDRPTTPGPTDDAASQIWPATEQRHEVRALSWNLYVGADVDAVIAALQTSNPEDDLPALIKAVRTAKQTSFTIRARAIARILREYRPAVFGVTEAWQLDVELPPYELALHEDFIRTLQVQFREFGLPYRLAASVEATIANPFPGVSMVDRNAIFVDETKVRVATSETGHFANNIGELVPGVLLRQGWAKIKTEMHGDAYDFVVTRLESGRELGMLRAAQAQEIVAVAEGMAPVMVMGDFNDVPRSPMYQVLTAADLYDGWRESNPGQDGLTCCHVPDLSNPRPQMYSRIDYIFMRGFETPGGVEFPCEMKLFGVRVADRLPGPRPLWPSDHAGLIARVIGTERLPHPE